MKILYTAFNRKNNSSKILLDKIKHNKNDKLYLKNSFTSSIIELQKKIKEDNYDLIISFGQAPLKTDLIKIETKAKNNDYYITTYDYSNLKELFDKYKFNTVISDDAGNYLCNNLYYNGLKIINEEKLKCKMIFIHIPKIKNISNINLLASLF